ncbi:sigma-70 family RNA polymerase sigma factor [Clostridium sardiniense]|uniref:Sigma-70 family RNA polymerase sigma factor n=1 Tax=Clostridium sardiniense TaxID=29369 RepID=A0ABS7KYZ3_CLOSR|nr:sigma-70 family RNA polymerase sigma factor [Clostridium sardiniense]MBY0756036.1 sigma-70 family RNA polymerase sigma factor [Clostridium sardiniense]MDQ0460674.1 RNA polymerase sigma-70 factor (ECF subfamily) [Clostridium sardiniense]
MMQLTIFKKERLVRKAKSGERDAFSELIRENKLSLYKVARGMLKRECDIEDAIQNTIMKAFEGISSLRNNSYFKTWLIRILINECNVILKSNKRESLTDVSEGFNELRHNDEYENLDVTNAVNMLEVDLREVIVLYYFEDFKQKDISEILGIKEGTVRTRLLRAKKKLKEILGERE